MLERYELNVLDFKSKKEIIPYIEQMFLLLEETYGKLQTFVPIQKYQKKGVTAIIFNEMQKTFNKNGYNIVETNPELIENTAIQQLWKNYENNQHKNRATFTKQI